MSKNLWKIIKKGNYVKGDVKEIMKAIREYEHKTDRNREVYKKSK